MKRADAMNRSSEPARLAALRRRMRWILLLGLVATGTELLLIGHDEDFRQTIPLVALAIAILAAVVLRAAGSTVTTRLFQAAMVVLMLTGAAGSVLHYRANMEFKREMDPSLSGFALFSSVIRAKAPPTLAPGTLALLGLLGLASVVRLDGENPAENA